MRWSEWGASIGETSDVEVVLVVCERVSSIGREKGVRGGFVCGVLTEGSGFDQGVDWVGSWAWWITWAGKVCWVCLFGYLLTKDPFGFLEITQGPIL